MSVSRRCSASGGRFWEQRPLTELSRDEWESLCDGCGRCCLHKLQDADTDEIYFTNVACRLLDPHTCRCSDYEGRHQQVADCIVLRPGDISGLEWLPSTCAYRRLSEGKALPEWHHWISGDVEAVHAAGVSIRGRVVHEQDVQDWEEHIVRWPWDEV